MLCPVLYIMIMYIMYNMYIMDNTGHTSVCNFLVCRDTYNLYVVYTTYV